MVLRGFTRKFKPLEILTEGDVEAIHSGTLEVLEETGVRFESERALKLFEKGGCKVDCDEMRVRFPPGLVEECLRKPPSSFHLKARDPKLDLRIGGNTMYFMAAPGMGTVDLDTWEVRTATRKENYDGVKILDALTNVHIISNYTPYFGFEGVPPVMALPECFAAKIRNSTKCLGEGFANACEVFNIEMAKAVGTELIGDCTSSPPLTVYREAVDSGFRHIEAGFPIVVVSGVLMGGTGPATIAGSMIVTNAEILAMLVMAQLIKPGARVVAGEFAEPMDMRTGSPAFADIGVSLQRAMFNQIWRKYGIPVIDYSMAYITSKKADFQCGYEKAIGAVIGALSGTNVINMLGAIHGELTHHPIQAILDDDVAGMIGRFVEGVEVTDETLALDLIEEVGPIPGFYLNKEHTRKWWKREQFMPKAADRLTYPEWMEKGKKSALDYAKERMEEILTTHKLTPLTPSQEEDIEKILKEAREYYREKGLISDEEWRVYRKQIASPNYPYG